MQLGKESQPDSEVSLSVGAGCIGAFINLSLLPLCGRLVGAEISVPALPLCKPSAFIQRCSNLCITGNSIIRVSHSPPFLLFPSIVDVVSRGFSHPLLPLTQENATLGNAEVFNFIHSVHQPL